MNGIRVYIEGGQPVAECGSNLIDTTREYYGWTDISISDEARVAQMLSNIAEILSEEDR